MKAMLHTCKSLFTLSFLMLFTLSSFAQTGIYEYKDKNTKTEIELNLRRDGVFFYKYAQEWAHCITQGKWKPLGNGKVVLTSDYQLDNYEIKEEEGPKEEAVHLIINSKGKGQSPTTITKIFINGDENNMFELDGEAGLKMLEERHRKMSSGSQADRESLAKTDAPRYYMFKGKTEIKTITMIFDKKEIEFEIESTKTRKITLTTAFAPNAAYHYMNKTEFIQSDKYISEAGSAIKLKKQKR